jgi:molybdopterin/thiamine biosynthesis adenylyltransferase
MGENIQAQDAAKFYEKAFARNIGILTSEEQEKLRYAKVAIAGAGGVGGSHLIGLVRAGIGKFHIADMDRFEIANFQRQCGADMNTLGKNKARVMKEMALAINPHLSIKSFEQGVLPENVDEFLDGADVLIDGIDFFCIDVRRMLFSQARKRGIYAVTAGPLGFGSGLLVFSPEGMSFDEYFDINDEMKTLEQLIAFAVGLAPAAVHMKYLNLGKVDIGAKTGPALISACYLCSSLAITEVLRILLKRKNLKSAPHYFQFDPYEQQYKKGRLFLANRNPIQKLKRWFLMKKFSGKS